MPETFGGIIVEPNGKTLVVTFTNAGGKTPAVYTTANGSSAHSLPVTITETTAFHFPARGGFFLSAKLNDDEIAGRSGSTFPFSVENGSMIAVSPDVDPVEQLSQSGSTGSLDVTKAAATDDVINLDVTGDSADRFVLNADGSMEWGPGSAAVDVRLRRTAANTLTLDRNANGSVTLLGTTGDDTMASKSGISFGSNINFGAGTGFRFYVGASQVLFVGSTFAFSEAFNIAFGTATGTKIGTGTTQKIGFFNATPVVQPASPGADATDLASVITLANNIKARLVALGLTA